jgi:ABC-type Fe3+/spermidine/putrescine transport system ATPase subunit
MKSVFFKHVLCAVLLACLPITHCFAAAGKFNFVIGDVRVKNASGERKAERGGEVEANETIVSGKDGMAQLRLSDGAFIALRADTELRIDKYQYDSQKTATNDTVLSLVKGTMRAFTGAIANFNKDKFKMITPTATIGIRGSGNVLNFSPVENLTLNHTIEGSHTVTTFDPSGVMRTLVTAPGQTVQVNTGGAMQFVPTPAFIIEAATAARKIDPNPPRMMPTNQPLGGPGSQQGNAKQPPMQGGMAPPPGGMAVGMPGAKMYGGAQMPGMPAPVPGMPAPMPGMYGAPAMATGGMAMYGATPMPGMNPGAPGMYGAAVMPGMPAPMPGMYGAPMMDPVMMPGMNPSMSPGMAPGMYGEAAMPVMYGAPPVMMPGMPAPTQGMYSAAQMPGMYAAPPMAVGGMAAYGAAPMPGMYGAPSMEPAMVGMNSGAAPGMYVGAAMPGMSAPPLMEPAMGGMNPAMAPAMTTGTAMPGMATPAPGMYASAPMPGVYAVPTMDLGRIGGMNPVSIPGMGMATIPVMPVTMLNTYSMPAITGAPVATYTNCPNITGYSCISGAPTLMQGFQIDPATGLPALMAGYSYSNGVATLTGTCATNPALCGTAGGSESTCNSYGYTCMFPPYTPTLKAGFTLDPTTNMAVLMPGYTLVNEVATLTGTCATNPAMCTSTGGAAATCSSYGYTCSTPPYTPTLMAGFTLDSVTHVAVLMTGYTYANGVATYTGTCATNPAMCATTGGGSATCNSYGYTCSIPPYTPTLMAGFTLDSTTNTAVLMSGYTLVNGVATLTGTCATNPALCTASTTPTCSSFGYTCSLPPYTTPTLMTGYSLDQYGNPYLNGSLPAYGYTHNSTGTLILLAAGISGGSCSNTTPPVGLFSCDIASNTWKATTFATPGGLTPPTTGKIYDAFNSMVTMPTTYRNIGYVFTDSANVTSMEMALNNSTTTVFGGAIGGLTSYQLPLGGATTSTNTYQRDIGTAVAMDFGVDAATGMMWGRWKGGAFVQTQLGFAPVNVSQAGSLHWFSTGVQNQAVTLPVTGTWNYTLVGNTPPTDNAGTSGTLNSANFSANFTTQTVNVGVNVSLPASPANAAFPVTLNASAVGVPIMAGGNFKTTTPTVTCVSGTCGATGGVIGGQFSAPNGAGVGVGYGLKNGPQTVSGVAVFRH